MYLLYAEGAAPTAVVRASLQEMGDRVVSHVDCGVGQ